jgi:hypothetical protein
VKRARLVFCLIVSVGWSGMSGGVLPSQARTQIAVPTDPASVGYLNLTKRHPDAADGPTEFATGYSPTTALQRLDQLRGFLNSFKQLTARARGPLTAADLRAAGNTSAEIQSIGFHNIPLVVEGTLLKQDYQLKQVAYELARLRHFRGEVAEQDVERARVAYAEATKQFQVFWDTKRPTD